MKNLLYIGNKLSEHGFTMTSIETLGPLLEQEGYNLFYASSKKNKILRFLDMLFKTFYLRKKVDFLIIDTYSTSNFWYAYFVCKLAQILKIKYIPILHGGNLPKRLDANLAACKSIFNSAYKIVSPSGYLMHFFEKKGFKNLIQIPNSISISEYPFLKREKFEPKILWVRSFSNIYNPKMAVDVLNNLVKDFPNASLCMVGPEKDGSLIATKKYAKELNLAVQFTDKLPKKEWIELSKEFDFFINTTHFDNTPVSVIEAMALGLPIISTNVGGLPFLLKNEITGILVDDSDTIAMADAIKKLAQNPSKAFQLANNARQESLLFDWSNVKLQWIKILQ